MTWTSISFHDLYSLILESEKEMDEELSNFWGMIKVNPQKWEEESYGKEGGGFWVVAIVGKRVVYYNDIEEGFNISTYTVLGKIDHYWCDEDRLEWSVKRVLGLIKSGDDVIGNLGHPHD